MILGLELMFPRHLGAGMEEQVKGQFSRTETTAEGVNPRGQGSREGRREENRLDQRRRGREGGV